MGLPLSTICPMEPAGVGFVPGPLENGMPLLLGQYDLLKALEAELDHNDLIRDISLMQWNLKVQHIPNYSLRWPYRSISNLGHNDLHRDLADKD